MEQDFAPPLKKAVDAVGAWFKSTAHLPTLRDTAVFGVVIPAGTEPLLTDKYLDVKGELRAVYIRPESELRLEVWQRWTKEQDCNLRIIIAEPPTAVELAAKKKVKVVSWDLGPSIRRDSGGAIIPDGLTENLTQIGSQLFTVKVNSREARFNSGELGNCKFEMIPMRTTRLTKEIKPDDSSHGFAACALTFDPNDGTFMLSIDTHGWIESLPDHDNPAALFRNREDLRKYAQR